ncbi:hypothetical protein DY000_02028021 [Brassica cretica]|uniref:Uncharacterized protein n=1 Tax=Brassica cretica TaxID=69181 RepID=A0ABQ7EE52_BRACR|nr:hypothetical protein DY000_02028021 [Brassica cretica]
MAGRYRRRFNSSGLSNPLHTPAMILRRLSSIFCSDQLLPLGAFNDSSSLFWHQNTPWGTEFIMKLSPASDKD